MDTFLKAVANDLYNKFGSDLSRTAIIFPNKRAGLFLNQWLADQSETPLWSPVYLTISELFRTLSPYTVGDPIKLVCDLYQVFREETNSTEPLDSFYFWGEMLLADFDDLDKNMADAQQLFSNLSELKKLMDDHSFLDEEQEKALQTFFHNFSIEKSTELKQRFLSLWSVLNNIYLKFHEKLSEQKIAYEGMLYRSVINEPNFDDLPYERYVFVGFNVLNKVEYNLFSLLRDQGKGYFYWDYDKAYLNNTHHEAGEFIRRNLKVFPNELTDKSIFNNLSGKKEIHYIAASTENAQAHYLSTWLRENITPQENETAIVLCNETLLQPVLHSLPNNTARSLNVTMGFPLSQTPVYTLICLLLELHSSGYDFRNKRYSYQFVNPVLKHPYVKQLSQKAKPLEIELTRNNRFFPLPEELQKDEFLNTLFPSEGIKENIQLCQYLLDILQKMAQLFKEQGVHSSSYNQLYQESLFKAYTIMNRFSVLTENNELAVQTSTFCRLVKNVLSSISIPFHGEPAIGLQVMGVLETRNLDFQHLVLLSVNEGQLPKAEGDSSFIPYNLRKAFGMTTVEHKNAVYAYYFYRLMQRAERITLMYNTSSEGLNRGEMSRFMLQLLIESNHDIQRKSLVAGQIIGRQAAIEILKTPEIINRLLNRFAQKGRYISPSALNTYLDCQLKFYFKYACGLKEANEVSTDIDTSVFGNIFHKTAEIIYEELTGGRNREISKSEIELLLKNEYKIRNYVDKAFKEIFFKIPEKQRAEYNGLQLLNSEVIITYIKQLLQRDAEYAPFTFIASEYSVKENIPIQIGDNTIELTLGGSIDRIDEKEGILRIVDYKTGSRIQEAKEIDVLFDNESDKRPYHIFQIFLYAGIMEKQQQKPISPALFYIQKAASAEYSPIVEMGKKEERAPVCDFSIYKEDFSLKLKELLNEIFNSSMPFTQTSIEKNCTFCEFAPLCGKK